MTVDERKLEILRQVAQAFDRHDLDAIMEHFADNCEFYGPRGSEASGTRFVGKAAVREAFAGRFAGIPDVRYTDHRHFVSGDDGLSEWLLSGTDTSGQRIAVRGCDIWKFDGDRIVVKNSFWKIRT